MLRRALASLAAGVVLVGTSATAAFAYTPEQGAIFNNPRGSTASKDRIITHLVKTIDSTPRYSVIRIAAWWKTRSLPRVRS